LTVEGEPAEEGGLRRYQKPGNKKNVSKNKAGGKGFQKGEQSHHNRVERGRFGTANLKGDPKKPLREHPRNPGQPRGGRLTKETPKIRRDR